MEGFEHVDAVTLVREVDRLQAFVASRMHGFTGEVDNVMQEARIRVWELAGRYDPSRGSAEAFVVGVVKMVVRHEVGRLMKARPHLALIETDQVIPGAETTLVEDHESTAWSRLHRFVADAATAGEWAVMVELARHGHLSERGGRLPAVAEALNLSVRQVRAMRDRVRTLWRAALSTANSLDDGLTPKPSWCVPDQGCLRAMLAHLEDPVAVGAATLRISEGAFRTNRAFVSRILGMVEAITRQESQVSLRHLNAS